MGIAKNIKYDNNRWIIEEVFGICMLSPVNSEGFKHNLSNVIRWIDCCNNSEKELLNKALTDIFNKTEIEKCGDLINDI